MWNYSRADVVQSFSCRFSCANCKDKRSDCTFRSLVTHTWTWFTCTYLFVWLIIFLLRASHSSWTRLKVQFISAPDNSRALNSHYNECVQILKEPLGLRKIAAMNISAVSSNKRRYLKPLWYDTRMWCTCCNFINLTLKKKDYSMKKY